MNEKDLILTIQDARDHLGIDFDDPMTDRKLTHLIKLADKWTIGAIGSNYPRDDERVKELQLMLISDLYNTRDLSEKAQSAARRVFKSMLQQLQLERRRASEGGESV